MNLGCLVTKQDILEYAKAKEYMDAAISLQEQIANQNQFGLKKIEMADDTERNRKRSKKDQSTEKLSDQLLAMEVTILAFRHYSRGFISYHFFVSAEEESRYKFKLRDSLLAKYGIDAHEAR